ncbi:MAG: hypothetical protein OEU32_15515 [Acidimicrobiia bacterium]|nr:hypothetical protein [Acidimicrobiia bacterium]
MREQATPDARLASRGDEPATSPPRAVHSSLLGVAAVASGAAGLLHGVAVDIHAETPQLARVFIALAIAQCTVGAVAFSRRSRDAVVAVGVVNAAAFTGWFATRIFGISWIDGLQVAERPQLTDTTAAGFAAVAVIGALAAIGMRTRQIRRIPIIVPAVLAAGLAIPAVASASAHQHDHGEDTASADEATGGHDHDEDDAALASSVAAGTAEADDHGDHADSSSSWPRRWDPTGPIDFSGVAGVTPEQQDRAERLVVDTLDALPRFADSTTLAALGYRSIGDSATGFEHFINTELINDDTVLDPTAPESLVYEVDGDRRTLVSAMFIAKQTSIDDPALVDFGGPLMQWHVHTNLCWGLDDDGEPKVMAVTDDNGGVCPAGTVNAGGDNPMVHVWIAPHDCGPFAALEGHGAGQADAADGQRADQCGHDHGGEQDTGSGTGAAVTTPYDPTMPIDLSGVDGVTPQQQAFAENLVAATIRDLPQWNDLDVVEAAGFRSIGDGGTGHEHYIQWDWIDDDIVLDPDYPESLVFEPQPDGSKELVSAMFMMPTATPLEDVPDWGGQLMQWHVHGDLCFTDDPVAPQVAGLKPIGTACAPPLRDVALAPMIHVWIRPHECGPFAALDGIGGGQVPDGEAVWCDDAHGAH